MKQQFKISVIIPIYNVEKYLEETIKSVISQTIGFKKNIQMILVNDGSTDNSEAICLKYKNKYPNNIIYIKQKNSGVSSARNNGLKYAEAEYINFLDSDDTWDKDAFKKGYELLSNNKNINLVSYRMKFFDAKKGYHALDFKFKNGDRIVNLNEEYKLPQLSGSSCMIRYSALKNKKFSEILKISEDARLINEIILENLNIGLISSSCYNYRQRKEKNSAINKSTKIKNWYLDTPKLCYKYLFDLSKKKYNKVIKYIQFLILYDLQWRIFTTAFPNTLTNQEKSKYISILKDLLKDIDDDVIIDAPFGNNLKKL